MKNVPTILDEIGGVTKYLNTQHAQKVGASKIFTLLRTGALNVSKSDSNNFTLLTKGCTTVKH